jgi:putative endonuclease
VQSLILNTAPPPDVRWWLCIEVGCNQSGLRPCHQLLARSSQIVISLAIVDDWENSSPGKTVHLGMHLDLGRRGEELAAAYLEQCGYRIVAANFKLPVGRTVRGAIVHAEIDLVAYDGATLCFIEVKTRASDWFAPPQVNVDLRKRRQIARASRAYRRMFNLNDASYRYDVVSIVLPAEGDDSTSIQIDILRDFWTEGALRKRRWSEEYYYY